MKNKTKTTTTKNKDTKLYYLQVSIVHASNFSTVNVQYYFYNQEKVYCFKRNREGREMVVGREGSAGSGVTLSLGIEPHEVV